MKFLLFIIGIISSINAVAQKSKADTVPAVENKTVKIIADPRFDLLVNKPGNTASAGTRQYKTKGYRVQIYSGNNRQEAMDAKVRFMKSYPGIRSYLIYTSPQYRIRVGDCRSRGEAEKLKEQISGQFQPCMIVPDEINVGVTGKSESNSSTND